MLLLRLPPKGSMLRNSGQSDMEKSRATVQVTVWKARGAGPRSFPLNPSLTRMSAVVEAMVGHAAVDEPCVLAGESIDAR